MWSTWWSKSLTLPPPFWVMMLEFRQQLSGLAVLRVAESVVVERVEGEAVPALNRVVV